MIPCFYIFDYIYIYILTKDIFTSICTKELLLRSNFATVILAVSVNGLTVYSKAAAGL